MPVFTMMHPPSRSSSSRHPEEQLQHEEQLLQVPQNNECSYNDCRQPSRRSSNSNTNRRRSRRRRHQNHDCYVLVVGAGTMFLLLALSFVQSPKNSCVAQSPSMIPKRRRQQQQQQGGGVPTASTTALRSVAATSSSTGRSVDRRKVRRANSHSSQQQAPWVTGMKNSVASALAAGCSKLILAPFDTIKTLQQHSRSASTATAAAATSGLTLLQAAKTIAGRPKGILEFYAGIGVAVVGSMPSVGLYFGIYSFCKKKFQQLDPHRYEDRQTLYIALSAAIGNTIASASRVPYEVVKQNFQTQVYTSMADCIKDMSFKTLFPTGGIASQMLRDIPYAVVTLLAYEHLKTVWKPKAERRFSTVPTRSWDLMVGGLAGGVGSYVTNPMDVLKTRLQTDGSGAIYGGSVLTCVQQTWQEGGPSAFLRGSVPRLLHKVPANAFFFLFYELFRSVLRVQDDSNNSTTVIVQENNKKRKNSKTTTTTTITKEANKRTIK